MIAVVGLLSIAATCDGLFLAADLGGCKVHPTKLFLVGKGISLHKQLINEVSWPVVCLTLESDELGYHTVPTDIMLHDYHP